MEAARPGLAPASGAELARTIEDACRFIVDCKRRHAAQIGWEVGEYLFEHVYRGDAEYARLALPTKEDSLADIAARTGIHPSTLQCWVRAHVARKLLVPAGVPAELPLTSFEALRPLAAHADAARAVLELRERHGLSVSEMDRVALAWKRRIDEGGSLQDIVGEPLPSAVAAGVRRRAEEKREAARHPRRSGSSVDLAVPRLADLVLRWIRAATFAADVRASLAPELARVRAVVASGGPSAPAAAGRPERDGPPGAAAGVSTNAGGAERPVLAPADRQRVIDDAVRFVRDRVRRHGLQLALEVGEHLFLNVFRGDRELFHHGGVWGQNTIQRIARDPRVGVDDNFLYRCIRAYLLVQEFGERSGEGAVPALPMTTWAALWPLETRPEALAAVGGWAAAEEVPAKTVQAVAAVVEPYLAAGGSLDDLLVAGRSPAPDTPYGRVLRILGVIATLASRRPPSAAARAGALSSLDAGVRLLSSPGRDAG